MKKDYKFVGCANSWRDKLPDEVKTCMDNRHRMSVLYLNNRGTYKEYSCDICRIRYTEDSSD